MSTEDSFRGVELLDFMRNDDGTTCTSNVSHNDSAVAATAGPPLMLLVPVDFEMCGPPEVDISNTPYLKNITQAPTWEIAVKVQSTLPYFKIVNSVQKVLQPFALV